jgi:hypothetical protein
MRGRARGNIAGTSRDGTAAARRDAMCETRNEKIIAVKTASEADSAALTFPQPARNISCP